MENSYCQSGMESSFRESNSSQFSDFYETSDAELLSNSTSIKRDTKECPVCAEVIKLEAIKCKFCGEKFDPADVARQVAKVRNEDSFENRVLCSDGNCIGVIGADGRCNVCGQPYKPDGTDI